MLLCGSICYYAVVKEKEMSILLKGLSLEAIPDDEYMVVRIWNDGSISTASCSYGVNHGEKRAVEVPTPHGRLKDADAFEARARAVYCDDCDRRKGMKNGKVRMVYEIGDVPCRACETGDMLCDIEDCPTMIEAEEDNYD